MQNQNLKDLLNLELKRQQSHIELIASENYVHPDVLIAQGSILTNKYAEGYPNRRYYSGCEYIDQVEQLAIDKAKEIFKAKFANVQPHSGSQANAAAYLALLKPNDVILAMGLNEGGHLTHGASVNFSGLTYQCYHYGVDKQTQEIDYDKVYEIAKEVKPQLIVCGASNYSKKIDFKKFGEIAKSVGAYCMADIAHISGLVVTGYHQNPIDYVDVVTTTTHKTLRGARGGLILTNNEAIAKKINSAVFPGVQGGPLMHIIAGKYICFDLASKDEFKTYIKNVIDNSKVFCEAMKSLGYKIIANGTDNHLFSVDVFSSKNVTGDVVENWLNQCNIVVNKNLIPYDTNTPKAPSGIRVGTAAMTTRNFKANEFIQVAHWIDQVISSNGDINVINKVKQEVDELTNRFGIYRNLKY